jgi:hypothetical protein
MSLKFGDDSEKVTPVPIPNTEVKLLSADGSWGFTPVRVGRRQATKEYPSWVLFFDEKKEHLDELPFIL